MEPSRNMAATKGNGQGGELPALFSGSLEKLGPAPSLGQQAEEWVTGTGLHV